MIFSVPNHSAMICTLNFEIRVNSLNSTPQIGVKKRTTVLVH